MHFIKLILTILCLLMASCYHNINIKPLPTEKLIIYNFNTDIINYAIKSEKIIVLYYNNFKNTASDPLLNSSLLTEELNNNFIFIIINIEENKELFLYHTSIFNELITTPTMIFILPTIAKKNQETDLPLPEVVNYINLHDFLKRSMHFYLDAESLLYDRDYWLTLSIQNFNKTYKELIKPPMTWKDSGV